MYEEVKKSGRLKNLGCMIRIGEIKMSFSRLIENNKKVIVFFFFLVFLFVGLTIYDDYGVHRNEFNNQDFGKRWTKYILDVLRKGSLNEAKISIQENHDWVHGPIFELFLVFAEKKLFNLSDSRDIILMRYLFTFLSFYIAVFTFYLLCTSYFKNWKIALLGSLFLILHPRVFSHSFFNSVDIPFLSFYLVSTYTLIRYLEKKTYFRAVFHALTCAILIDIRVVGIIIPLLTSVFLAMDIIIVREDKEEIRKNIKIIIVYVLLLIALTFLFWPLLWRNPISNFLKSFCCTAKLYRLRFTPLWYYNLKWIMITTPLVYSFCFFIGFFLSIKALFKDPIKFYLQNSTILIAIFLLFVPLILPIICKTSLFGDWRHHYFIYPIFLIFSLMGLVALSRFVKRKFHGLSYRIINTAFILVIASGLVNTVWFMVKYHPHQNVYANILAGRDMRYAKFDFALDNGCSYRKALEYILENDKSSNIVNVSVANLQGEINAKILPPDERRRLRFVSDISEADYFLSIECDRENRYGWDKGEYYSLKVGTVKFMVVYKLYKK